MAFHPGRRLRFLPFVFLAVVAALVTAGFLATSLAATGGHVVAPLDDSYIYFQYAKRLAQGRFFSYSGDDGYSSGVTSMLYPLLLSPFYAVGVTGEAFVAAAILLGGLLLAASAAVMYLLVKRATGHWAPALVAGLLVLLNGRLAWGYLSGMEIALFTTALLATVWLWTTPGREGAAALAATVLVLSRPEGLVFGVALGVLTGARVLLERRRPESLRGRLPAWRIALYAVAPVAAGSVPFLLNLALTGVAVSNTGVAHSSLYAPFTTLAEVQKRALGHAQSFFARGFTGDYVPASIAGGSQATAILALLGFLVLAVREVGRRTLGVGAVALVAGLATVAAEMVVMPSEVHHYRYYMPYMALAVVGLVAGVHLCLVHTPWRRSLVALVPALLVVGPLVSLPGWARVYGSNAADIRYQHVAMAQLVRRDVPPEALLGVNDVGAIAYYTDQSVFDLVGLTSNGVAGWSRQGDGSIWEMLERLPRRPDYLAAYPRWFPAFAETGTWRRLGAITLEEPTIAGEAEMALVRPEWSLAGSGETMKERRREGFSRIVDRVDVADLESERQHGYTALLRWDGGPPRTTVTRAPYAGGADVMDGGRLGLGGERMRVRTVPGAPLLIVRRAYAHEGVRLRVRVNGEEAGGWAIGPSVPVPQEQAKGLAWCTLCRESDGKRRPALRFWSEEEFLVPGSLVTAAETAIEFRLDVEPKEARRRAGGYSAYYYWFLQPETAS